MSTTQPQDTRGTTPTRLYLLIGALIGFVWFLRGDAPAWEHAVRALILLVVALPVAQFLLNRARRQSGSPPIRLRRVAIAAAKLLLVAVALIAQLELEQVTPRATLIVSVGILVVVWLVGPRLHRYFVATGENRTVPLAEPR